MRGCPLCEKPWQEVEGVIPCGFCGTEEKGEFRCGNGHYVCEDCRTGDPREVVIRICERSTTTNPLALWELVTSHGAFRGHGPQFHFVLVPILATVLRNRGLQGLSQEQIRKAVDRLSEIPALSCAETGICGTAATAGVIVSLITGATPVSNLERRMALSATAKALLEIAFHHGGRCCRQSSLATLESIWVFLRIELKLPLEPIEVVCRRSAQTPNCKQECVYHE